MREDWHLFKYTKRRDFRITPLLQFHFFFHFSSVPFSLLFLFHVPWIYGFGGKTLDSPLFYFHVKVGGTSNFSSSGKTIFLEKTGFFTAFHFINWLKILYSYLNKNDNDNDGFWHLSHFSHPIRRENKFLFGPPFGKFWAIEKNWISVDWSGQLHMECPIYSRDDSASNCATKLFTHLQIQLPKISIILLTAS